MTNEANANVSDSATAPKASDAGRPSNDTTRELLISSAPVIAGAVIGAVFTLLSSYLVLTKTQEMERERWSREDRTRFHTYKQKLYSEYLATSDMLARLCLERHDLVDDDGELPDNAPAALLARIDDRFFQLEKLLKEIALVSDVETNEAASNIIEIVGSLEVLADSKKSQFENRYIDLSREQSHFVETARRELGIKISK